MKKYLILISLIAVVVSGCLMIEAGDEPIHTVLDPPDPSWLREDFQMPETEQPETAELEDELDPETPTEPDASITISAVGDIIGSTENFQSVKSGDVYEFSGHFRELRDTFQHHDYTIANLVSPIAGADFSYSGYPTYNAPIELVQAVADLGIDALSTANRYAFDLGQRAVMSNLNNIRDIGLTPFGTATSQEEADQPVIIDVKGIKLGLLSYTALLNQSIANMPYAVSIAERSKIETDIDQLRQNGAELIVVNMYWGDEYADMPNAEQTGLMSFLESQGVDIVLGSHPHVVQPMVIKNIVYQGETKPMVQAYSLGNFYSAFLMNRTKTGLMLEIDIARQNGRAAVSDVRHKLLYNHQTDRGDGLLDFRIIDLATLEERRNDSQYNQMRQERDRVEELLHALDQ